MNKKLTPLQALKQFRNSQYQGVNVYADELLDIIETALERLEKIETTTHSVLKEDISNKLEALEIIKEKILDMDYFNVIADRCDLTYQEYELLRKVLK